MATTKASRPSSSVMAAPVTVGPVDGLLLVGNAMIEHRSGRPIAHLSDHQWMLADRHYLRIDFEGSLPFELRFIGPQSRDDVAFRPYRQGHAADGMIYTDGTPMARYLDDTDRWVCVQDGSEWPVAPPARLRRRSALCADSPVLLAEGRPA